MGAGIVAYDSRLSGDLYKPGFSGGMNLKEPIIKKFVLLTERGWRDLSLSVLLLFFIFYLAYWFVGNSALLFDPLFQNDDARTLLFPFHLYSADQGLARSVLAQEMLHQNLPAIRLLYFIFIKLTDIFWASKIIQGICFLIVFVSGVILARSRRFGPAGGVLLVFLFLHNSQVVNRIAGGMPRSFGFPLFSLWVAGILANHKIARAISCGASALFYPPVMLLILGAEGIRCFTGGFNLTSPFFWKKVRFYFWLVGGSFFIFFVSMSLVKSEGHTFTLSEARGNPAFGHEGFLTHTEGIPFASPAELFANNFLSPFRNLPNANSDRGEQREKAFMLFSLLEFSEGASLLFIVLFLLLVFSRQTPRPPGLVELIISSMVIYVLSRFFAFRLYVPERYYFYGMTAAGSLLAISVLGLLKPQVKKISRSLYRNVAVIIFMSVLLATSGGGALSNNGVTIEGYSHADLFHFIRSLPPDAHILAHPMEGDDILYWAGRDSMGGYETLHLFNVELWERRKREIEEIIQALYSVNSSDLIATCRKYGITHVLVNKEYYRDDFKERALYLEPFKSFARELLAPINREDLVLTRIPSPAVIYEETFYQIVDVSRLELLWNQR